MFLPAFRDWPKEADLIAHLLGGYGELEFMLAVCAGRALNDVTKAARAVFRVRGETARIRLADALMADAYEGAGLKAQYADALGATRQCLRIRNRFSHCHWASLKNEGLFLTELGEAALAGAGPLTYSWRHVTLTHLEECDEYFNYAHRCFWYIEAQFQKAHGRAPSSSFVFPMPAKRQPPPELSPPAPDILALLPRAL